VTIVGVISVVAKYIDVARGNDMVYIDVVWVFPDIQLSQYSTVSPNVAGSYYWPMFGWNELG
jgi:hypothetical protein